MEKIIPIVSDGGHKQITLLESKIKSLESEISKLKTLKTCNTWELKPDSEGWWWYKNNRLNRYEVCKVEYATDNIDLTELRKILLAQSFFTDGYVNVNSYDKGKWHKAVVPEEG